MRESGAETLEARKENCDAHRSYIEVRFGGDEMDFAFEWVLGAISCKGCELGEALCAASRIGGGHPVSRQNAWEEAGRRAEARADACLEGVHAVNAPGAYLRASNYCRSALVSNRPGSPHFHEMAEKTRSCLKKAGHRPRTWSPGRRFALPLAAQEELPGCGLRAASRIAGRSLLLRRERVPEADPAITQSPRSPSSPQSPLSPPRLESGWAFL